MKKIELNLSDRQFYHFQRSANSSILIKIGLTQPVRNFGNSTCHSLTFKLMLR
ncbi:hypothetical protein [Trichormus variabilis]|uniref:hypothetical protein n=1 Tax=Anabaena variabilis TaxID=264691 RepID=UPI001628E09D|nr:hypothetical protein [Trichormus variabilis]MBC1328333.1 hypothetical protein [Trichormus variabilis 9RC]